MRIERIRIDKFGALRGFTRQFGPGLTVILGGNESGKTTLAAFVRAMLYGLNGKSPQLAQNERKKYMPWGETAMGGSLRLETERGRYEIVRVFGQTKKSDTCRVVNAETGEIVPIPAGQEPGEVLLGLEEDVFCDTLYVSARGGRISGGAALAERIRNRMETGREDVAAEAVKERLRTARSRIVPRVAGKGELYQVQRALDDARQQLMREKALKKEEAELLRAVQGTVQERSDALHSSLELTEQRIEVQEQALAAQEMQEVNDHRRTVRLAATCGALAVLLAVMSAAGGLMWNAWAYLGLLAAVGAAVLALRCAGLGGGKAKRAAVDAVLKELSQLRQDQAMLRQQMQNLGQAEETGLRSRLQLEKVRQDLAQMDGIRKYIAALEAREDELLRSVQALDMAMEELGAAAKERREGVAPQLMQGMEEMLCGLTGARYGHAALSQEMELSVETEGGDLRSGAYFSGGTVEQMYLALRLSMVRALEGAQGKLPLILDDPLAQYDDDRAEDALQLLRHFAADGRQVLLLTCRRRDAQNVGRVIRMEEKG